MADPVLCLITKGSTNSVVNLEPGHQETWVRLRSSPCHAAWEQLLPAEVVDTALVVDDYPCMLSAQHQLYVPWRGEGHWLTIC